MVCALMRASSCCNEIQLGPKPGQGGRKTTTTTNIKKTHEGDKGSLNEAFCQDILLLLWLEQICFQESRAAFPSEDSWAEEFAAWTLP